MNKFKTNNDKDPWNRPNSKGELPGDTCCQRALGGRCHEHNPLNYIANVRNKTKENSWINTKEGRKKFAKEMCDIISGEYKEILKPKKRASPKNLVDIKGKQLEVGQHIVFCGSSKDTELRTGVIEKISPKSIYIKLDPDCLESFIYRQMGSKPTDENLYSTKRLLTTYIDDNPTYNRIEVYVFKSKP